MNKSNFSTAENVLDSYFSEAVGPVVYNYVNWIVDDVYHKGINRLYFLARDGYLLHKIAELICISKGFDIECRYLYCSRAALRMPTYHFIGDEMYNLLLMDGCCVSPSSLLARAELNEDECSKIYNELNIVAPDKAMSPSEHRIFTDALRKCETYKKLVHNKSKSAYTTTIDYFRNEKLFENNCIVIIDSGWTGSMQRSLRQLMESAGYQGRIIGYYFGLFAQPLSKEDGEYNTFYFSRKKHLMNKLMFNNNVFECMLSAPHPMTLGYEYINGKAKPRFAAPANEKMELLIERQISSVLDYASFRLKNDTNTNNHCHAQKECYRILKKNMVYPSKELVTALSDFYFCDDITESYMLPLTGKAEHLSAYNFITRIWKKLTGSQRIPKANLLWVYGTIELYSRCKWWHRYNALLWDWLRYFITTFK